MTELAATQHGAVIVAQLRAGGIDRRAQRLAVAAGWLTVATPGVVDAGGETRLEHVVATLRQRLGCVA